MHNLNILYERKKENINVISIKVLKNHASNDISDSIFSISFFDPLPFCWHIKCWSSLKTQSRSSFLLDLNFSPTIDNLIISRFLYSDLTCPNSYSKLILELPKLGSQGHLKFNTSKQDCYLMP